MLGSCAAKFFVLADIAASARRGGMRGRNVEPLECLNRH